MVWVPPHVRLSLRGSRQAAEIVFRDESSSLESMWIEQRCNGMQSHLRESEMRLVAPDWETLSTSQVRLVNGETFVC